MNFKISIILKSHWPKILSVFLFIILLGAYANIFAIGSPYNPGSTLDPDCSPGSINCYVDPNLSNPWLTGTSGIYTNNNAYIGTDISSVSTSIEGGLLSNTYNPLTGIVGDGNEMLPSDSFDMFSSVAINNDGNPVIAFYISVDEGPITYNLIPTAYASGPDSSLYVIVCSDPNCNDGTMNEIDSNIETFSNFRPIVKIGTDNIPRIVYEANTYAGIALRYAVCSDEICSSIEYSTNDYTSNYGLVNLGLSLFDDVVFFSLDTNDVPYILYNMYSGVSLARYTGTGTENSCRWSDGEFINPDWKCSSVLSGSNGDGYYLDYGIGDFVSLSDEGYIRFITEYYNDDSGSTYITYNECNDADCTDVTSTVVDLINEYDGWNTSSNLAINSDGTPYILYGFYDTSDNYRNDLKIAYLNEGNGSGCSESSNWSCVTIGSLNNNNSDYYWYSDMKIGEDNIPQIVVKKYLDSDGSYSIDYIKCSNTVCSNVTNSTIYSTTDSGPYIYYLGATLAISSNNSAYISYLDSQNELLLLTKISQSEGVSFNSSNNNSLYTGGDLGVSGNLFVDGSIVTPSGLYLNDGIPDVTSNALYNDGGDLYWGEDILVTGNNIDNYLPETNSFLGSTSTLGTETWLGTDPNNMGGNASTSGTVFIGVNAGFNAMNTFDSIFVGSSAGYYANNSHQSIFMGLESGYSSQGSGSNFMGYQSGYSSHMPYSNFFGSQAGYYMLGVGSNFLGYQAGYNSYSHIYAQNSSFSNFLGYQAGYTAIDARDSNFLGYQAGYNAYNAANSIFIGRQSGYNDGVNNKTTYNDSTTFANTSILIGHKTGTGNFSNSIAIGAYATNTATNQFMIGSTTRPINTTVWKGTNVTLTLDTATGLSTPSDQRLKTNIHMLNTNEDYMDYASSTRESYTEDEISEMTTLEKVLKITPVRYDWREDPDNEYIFEQDITPENIGFIAQDLINFFPEVVYVGHDENEYLGVNYANMTPILVEAIKEMNLKVKSFEDFEAEENSLRDNLEAWLANATNKITRIFTGEICLTDGSEEGPVCLNASELRELKESLSTQADSDSDKSNNNQTPPIVTCSDGIMNQDEIGIDEGGVCAILLIAPTCTDGILNQDETEIDTGGVCTPPADPTCSDGVMNQDETGIDEGGVCTPA